MIERKKLVMIMKTKAQTYEPHETDLIQRFSSKFEVIEDGGTLKPLELSDPFMHDSKKTMTPQLCV